MESQSTYETSVALAVNFPQRKQTVADMPLASTDASLQLGKRSAVATYLAGQRPGQAAYDRERTVWPANQFLQQPSIVQRDT